MGVKRLATGDNGILSLVLLFLGLQALGPRLAWPGLAQIDMATLSIDKMVRV